MDRFDAMLAAALARIVEKINRSIGQKLRRIREREGKK
jgi:hypothetical protein